MSVTIRAHTSGINDNNFNSYLDQFFTGAEPQVFDSTGFSFVRFDGHLMDLYGQFVLDGTNTIKGITGGTLTTMIFKNGFFSQETSFTVSGLNVDAVSMADAIIAKSSDQFFDLLGAIEFIGNQESDTFAGGDFADYLGGAGGADNLHGGAGDDTIAGGKSADLLAGGNGIDTLDYRSSKGAVTISLGPNATAQHGGDAEGDVVSEFENVISSSFNDKLQGDGGINGLDGGRGNDELIGGDGADRLIGGRGSDTADYSASGVGVSVNLGTGEGSGGHAQGDQLHGIENLKGSGFDDTLIGGILANSLAGSGGNDRLEGGAGKDNLDGGTGVDVLIGGTGIDTIAGRSGADTFVLFNKTLSADVIRDFTAGADTLEIDAILFGGGLAAGVDLDASAFEVNATGLASTEAVRFIFNSVTGELFFDINGSKNAELGRQQIATLEGTQTGFSESDFAIV